MQASSTEPRQTKRRRRGTSTLEAAFVLPVFLVFVFGLFEFGHAQMLSNVLKTAARRGARLGSTAGVSTAQVETEVRSIIATAMNADKATVLIKDISTLDSQSSVLSGSGDVDIPNLPDVEMSDMEPRELFLVQASVPYNQVSLVPMSWLGDWTITGQSVMRHE